MGLREKKFIFDGEKYQKKEEKTLSIFKIHYPPREGKGEIHYSAVFRAYTIFLMFVSSLLQLFTPHYLGTSNKTKTSDI